MRLYVQYDCVSLRVCELVVCIQLLELIFKRLYIWYLVHILFNLYFCLLILLGINFIFKYFIPTEIFIFLFLNNIF